MRTIGVAERALEEMCRRVKSQIQREVIARLELRKKS